ncbi:hypothetical protein MJO52_08175 [Microbulbifer variabilis]|uniref:Uncharacterized protein n=1 Tax=Microbulbifer variabilis TaxID=266805 RepID=A0ABY4VFQ9_9GAMM|nr:hypothetical protein [Microbulbifer variabilis]USD23098.1 hypothetical protein MJO52_08175 [Microbulbifer variabilis]
MSDSKLTKEQAFLAMYAFLDEYYQATKSEDVGGLLGSISLLSDGGSADPVVQNEWEEAIQKVMDGSVNAQLSIKNT